jgi:exodeoxyribonuclease V alpha subunit
MGAEQKAVRDIMVFLHAHGVGTSRAVRIFKTYGFDAIQIMTKAPYRLARDIRGIGFRAADAMAMKVGGGKAPQRVRARVSFRSAGGDRRRSLRASSREPAQNGGQAARRRQGDRADGARSRAQRRGRHRRHDRRRALHLPARASHAGARVAERLRALAAGAPPWPRIDSL